MPETPDPSNRTFELTRLAGLNPAEVMGLAFCDSAGDTPQEWAPPTPDSLAELFPGYEIRKLSGRGGMGAVYEAWQKNLARRVAIKILPVSLGDTPGFMDRFEREAHAMATLAHPGIVAVFDSGQTIAGHSYYVMEFVSGGDLAQKLATESLTVEQATSLLNSVCDALKFAHERGIIHRDLKPSNILLTDSGEPKLADFGLALLAEKQLEQSRLTMGGTTVGTIEYAAPEQLAQGQVSKSSDIYSLGVLAYELLTGELPRGVFDAPSRKNPQVDPSFDAVILQALQSDPARRTPTVAAFQAELQQAADAKLQKSRREAVARQKLRRRTFLAGTAALATVFAILLTLYALSQKRRAEAGELTATTQRDTARLTRQEAENLIGFMLGELQERLYEVNRLDVLEQTLQRVQAYYDSVPPTEGGDPRFLLHKAEFLELRGALSQQKQFTKEAIADFEAAQGIRQQLLESHPTIFDYFNSYLQGEFALALAYDGVGNLAAALRSHEKTVRAMQLFYGESAAKVTQAALMAEAMQADLRYRMGEKKLALEQAQNALETIDTALAEPNQAEEFAMHNVRGMLLAFLALAAETDGDLPTSAQRSSDRLAIYDRFLPRNKRHGYRELMYISAAAKHASLLLKSGELATSESTALAGYAISARYTKDNPKQEKDRQQTEELARIWLAAREKQGKVSNREQLKSEATLWIAAFSAQAQPGANESTLFDALVGHPNDYAAQFAWAMASEEEGRQIETTQGPQAALEFFHRQLSKLRPHLQKDTEQSLWEVGASFTMNRIATLEYTHVGIPKAVQTYRESLKLRQDTAKKLPNEPQVLRNLASSHSHILHGLIQQKDQAVAAPAWEAFCNDFIPVVAQGHKTGPWLEIWKKSQESITSAFPDLDIRTAAGPILEGIR